MATAFNESHLFASVLINQDVKKLFYIEIIKINL